MRRGERLPLPKCWAEHVDRYERHLITAQREKASIAYRLQPASAFARAHPETRPDAVTAPMVTSWLEAGGWQPNSLNKQRQGLAYFFAWMHRALILTKDPLAGLAAPAVLPPPPVSWRSALRGYRTWLVEGGRQPATVVDYVGFVERFARRDGDTGPWRVTTTDVEAWLDAGQASGWTTRTTGTVRSRLGSFYTWAIGAGWTTQHPCEPLSRRLRRRPPPKTWARTLSQYEAHMQTRGLSAATINRRQADLVRFAWEVGCSPWTVTPRQSEKWLARDEVGEVTATRLRGVLLEFYRWGKQAGRTRAVPVTVAARIVAPPTTPALWAHALEDWGLHLRGKGVTAGTLKTRRAHLRALAMRFPQCSPWEVDTEHLSAVLANDAWKQETRKSVRSSFASFFGWAELAGRIGLSPVRRLPGIAVPRALPRPINEGDLRQTLVTTVREHPREHLMLLFARYAGLRAGEIAGLHRRDIELSPSGDGWQGQLFVIGKGGHLRTVPLLPDLAEAVAAHVDEHRGFLFPGRSQGHLSAQYVSKLLSKRLGPRWTAHTLRHRFATNACAATNDLRATQELLGHSSPTVTARYTKVADRALAAAVMAAAADQDVDHGYMQGTRRRRVG